MCLLFDLDLFNETNIFTRLLGRNKSNIQSIEKYEN